jgi:hypothetical protein
VSTIFGSFRIDGKLNDYSRKRKNNSLKQGNERDIREIWLMLAELYTKFGR